MNFNTCLKESIARGVSRGTRKTLAALRRDNAALKRELNQLRRAVKDIAKKQGVVLVSRKTSADASDADLSFRRPNGASVRSLRRKFGLTQGQFAKLARVSIVCVGKWERTSGVVKMRQSKLQDFGKVRKMSRREARTALGL